MAEKRSDDTTVVTRLQAENELLRAENRQLKQAAGNGDTLDDTPGGFWRKFGAIIFAAFAVALLIAGNLLLWTGNTIVKSDRYTAAVAHIIRSPAVQEAVADYTTRQLYKNVDVTQVVQNALPPRAEFLAPTIASQLESHTKTALDKVLANPKFQETWNNVQLRAHDRFIHTVKQSGGDGTINLNELFQQLTASLKDTRLSFLAGKQLPDKVGSIQLVSGSGIKTLHTVIVHIDAWRIWAIILFLVCAGLAIYLSRRRRRAVIRLAVLCAAGLFLTLIAGRITREIVAGKAREQYAEAVRQTVQIVLHPLVIQTTTLLVLFLLVAAVAWVSGHSRSAVWVQSRLQFLLAGKLHYAVFGPREHAITRWIGRYKRWLEWIVVVVVAICMLVTRLTLMALLWYVIVTVLVVLIIETLASPVETADNR